jgi:hypothetical protein
MNGSGAKRRENLIALLAWSACNSGTSAITTTGTAAGGSRKEIEEDARLKQPLFVQLMRMLGLGLGNL